MANVKQFVEKYNNCVANVQKGNAIKEIMNGVVLGIAEKTAFANTIANRVCHTSEGKFKVGTVSESFHFTIELLRKYTNLEISENVIEVYDLLDQSDLLVPIIKEIPEKEYKELRQLTDLAISDVITNNSNVFTQIENAINSFGEMLTTAYGAMSDEDKSNVIDMIAARVNK